MEDVKSGYLETTFENNYQIDPLLLEKLINNKTKAIILCNPHNNLV